MTRKKGITVSQISMVGIRMPALIGGKIIRFYEPFLCVIPPPMSFNWIGWHDSYLGVSRRHDWEYENVSWIFLHFSLISQIFYTRCRAIHTQTHIHNRRKVKKSYNFITAKPYAWAFSACENGCRFQSQLLFVACFIRMSNRSINSWDDWKKKRNNNHGNSVIHQ